MDSSFEENADGMIKVRQTATNSLVLAISIMIIAVCLTLMSCFEYSLQAESLISFFSGSAWSFALVCFFHYLEARRALKEDEDARRRMLVGSE